MCGGLRITVRVPCDMVGIASLVLGKFTYFSSERMLALVHTEVKGVRKEMRPREQGEVLQLSRSTWSSYLTRDLRMMG